MYERIVHRLGKSHCTMLASLGSYTVSRQYIFRSSTIDVVMIQLESCHSLTAADSRREKVSDTSSRVNIIVSRRHECFYIILSLFERVTRVVEASELNPGS